MLTDKLRRAGWRECPDNKARKAWEDRGGRWQVTSPHRDGGIADPTPMATFFDELHPESIWVRMWWRPVNPQTWDYAPEGWGEDLTPTQPGYFWWQGRKESAPRPVQVFRHYLPGVRDGLAFYATSRTTHYVEDTDGIGHWLGPCPFPGGAR